MKLMTMVTLKPPRMVTVRMKIYFGLDSVVLSDSSGMETEGRREESRMVP